MKNKFSVYAQYLGHGLFPPYFFVFFFSLDLSSRLTRACVGVRVKSGVLWGVSGQVFVPTVPRFRNDRPAPESQPVTLEGFPF